MLALYYILYNLPIFVLHSIVFNVVSDNKNCCYKNIVAILLIITF